jgi:ribosome biogenesis GTPase / thiamine phosphate phosphatase
MSLEGRVCWTSRGVYEILTASGSVKASVPGSWRHGGVELPVVGDLVRFSSSRIEEVLPRKSVIRRKRPGRSAKDQVLAANVDVAFLVTGLDGDYSRRRIERYLVLAEASGIRPVIVLNKADLCASPWARLEEVSEIADHAPIILASARDGMGLDELGSQVAPGETAVLLGSSGAGKSTIVNRLLGRDSQPTQDVRESDSHGRHTTTGRHLVEVPPGWYLIDTPGLRELQPWTDAETVGSSFRDIAQLAEQCRFDDCSHRGEPGCAVTEAIECGELEPGRLDNLHRMEREAELLAAKTDLTAALEKKAREKKLHRMCRDIQQRNQKRR